MCEVESSGTIGNGMASSPVIKLNVSCPEEATLSKRESLHSVDSREADLEVQLEANEEKVSPEEEPPSGDLKDRNELPPSGDLKDQEKPPPSEDLKDRKDSSPSGDLKDKENPPPSGDLKDRRGSDGTREPLGVTPRISQDSIVDGSLEVGGVDPFKPSGVRDEETNGLLLLPPKDSSDTAPSVDTVRRDSKTVSFKEPGNEEDSSVMNDVRLSNSTTSSTSNVSKEDDGAVEKRRSSGKPRALGENNPVYRLSMKLSPNLFNVQEIPGANQHREADKAGYLTKLSGRSFPYIAQWKRRYCVLAKGRLYYYEREDSKPGEKSNGVVNLEYFDQVTEAGPKDCKKATNVFVITSQDRSFFDPGRHLFSADTLPDMKDWVRKLQSALEQIRNNTRPAATSTLPSSKKEGGKKGKEQATENKENNATQGSAAKERKKKKDSHRPRKSARVGDGPETPLAQESSSTQMTSRREAEPLPTMTSSIIGIQLPGMTSQRGVPLPGLSPTKKEPMVEETRETTTITTTTTSDSIPQSDEGLPASGPTLTCVTKQRNKGPQGRRAPQNRRTMAAASLKKRASSLSALEYQDLNDNSEAQWLNKSLDMLDEGCPAKNGEMVIGCAPALPYKAYNYSTDEDDTDDDGEHSQSDSFPTSAAAMPPPPPPRSASYGLELRQNTQLSQAGRQVLHRSLGDGQGSGGDIRGSKRSLGEGRMYGLVGEWRGSCGEQWIGSHSSLGHNGDIIGGASPVMDDLDNMLMNQSIQQTSLAMDSGSESASEGSTCRPAGKQQAHQLQVNHQPTTKQPKHHKKKSGPDLTRFAMAVKHLQRHVVEIDRAVFGITGDVTGTRQEVTALKEAVLALQSDTDTITSTLSHLTEEAITAQQKITLATQIPGVFLSPVKEAEKVRKIATVALKEAEQAKQEQVKSKKEYESLLAEMKSTMKMLKESQSSFNQGQSKTPPAVTPKETSAKSQDSASVKTPISKLTTDFKSSEIISKPAEESLKSSVPKGNKVTGESQANSSSSLKVSESSGQLVPSAKPEEESSKSSKSNRSTVESFTSSSSSSRLSGGSASGVVLPPPVSKSNSYTQVSHTHKLPAYQSLFARPSSLISGLTQRTPLSKSVSFADQKDKEKLQEKGAEAKLDSETAGKKRRDEKHQSTLEGKDKKHQSTLEGKDKKGEKHQPVEDKKPTYNTNSKERKSKDKKDSGSLDRREKKHRHPSKDKRSNKRGSKDEEHMISNLSLEDIPMADDNSNELIDRDGALTKKTTPVQVQSLSNSTQTPSNFSLGKSSSSPVVLPGLSSNKPRSLLSNKDHYRNELCSSTASTPESPMPPCPFPQTSPPCSRPTSPSSRSSSALPTVEENHSIAASSPTSLHRPGSTPGPLSRQGSMTTVPEDRAVTGPTTPPSRPGVFAISRQNSSPNLPIQRQNSGVSIPLQRQHSLGTVPEEGRLPRQESLMSVPEDRPLVDRTLPLSPSQSMTYFPISPSTSASTVSECTRRTVRASMEMVTGPVLAGSSMQEAAATGTLAVLINPEEELKPMATSTLRKDHKPQKDVDGVAI